MVGRSMGQQGGGAGLEDDTLLLGKEGEGIVQGDCFQHLAGFHVGGVQPDGVHRPVPVDLLPHDGGLYRGAVLGGRKPVGVPLGVILGQDDIPGVLPEGVLVVCNGEMVLHIGLDQDLGDVGKPLFVGFKLVRHRPGGQVKEGVPAHLLLVQLFRGGERAGKPLGKNEGGFSQRRPLLLGQGEGGVFLFRRG